MPTFSSGVGTCKLAFKLFMRSDGDWTEDCSDHCKCKQGINNLVHEVSLSLVNTVVECVCPVFDLIV